MQGSNPTIYAVVLSIMRSLVEMHVSGAVNHPDPKGLQKLSIMEILQHNPHDLPRIQKLSAVTFLHLLSLLPALPDLAAHHQHPAPLAAYPPENMAF